MQSPSVWREWIEIANGVNKNGVKMSPSVWREWIEMSDVHEVSHYRLSPSVWREWIEICCRRSSAGIGRVSLRVEGVD